MGAPGLTTPLRSETFENLQLNAGIFLKNFTLTGTGAPTDASTLKAAIAAAITAGTNILGATRGGGTFVVTREIREPDVDGRRYPFMGGKFVDSADARLSTTLIEVTPENIKDALGSATLTKPTGSKITTITMNTAISDGDYLDNVVWVGDLADGRFVCIVLYNALNTADFTLTFADKNEGTLAVEFHAHQAEVDDYDEAPFEILYFED